MISILEQKEAKNLAPYAISSNASRGRKYSEVIGDNRLCFQRDKDRIIHSKAFRRLDEKTQVFMAGSGDHYRTRLTHTLEVAQISRDIARRLALNEDLCEAIALAHDLGHPPFGHAGEHALDQIMHTYGLHFEHNEQSRRVVEVLEKAYPGFDGLNLTYETIDGLIKHQTAFDQFGKKFDVAAHLEAQVVNLADEIAYTNHDIDDGLRSGLITLQQLEKLALWKSGEKLVHEKYGRNLQEDVLIPRTVSAIMSLMIDDLYDQTLQNLQKNKIKTAADVRKYQGLLVEFSSRMKGEIKEMRYFLFQNFYMHPKIVKNTERGERMIRELFTFYIACPKQFPPKKPDPIRVKDYIAGMTDSFLIKEYSRIFRHRRKLCFCILQ